MSRPRPSSRALRWLRMGVLGPFGSSRGSLSAARQSLVALVLNSGTSLVAGLILGSITGTLERLPGLLVLVPAAIGLRGNVFSALGSRLSTAIHTGTYSGGLRRGTVLGDNVLASLSLTAGMALVLAVVAKAVAVAFGIENTISVLDLTTISIAGGLLASILVLAATVGLASVAIRREWDLDDLVAPLVSTLGDVLTLPALVLATALIGHGLWSVTVGWLLVLGTVAGSIAGVLSVRPRMRSIVRQSWPVLFGAVVLSTLAGLVIERQLSIFGALPGLLILVPAFVSSAGALGGILSSRYATGLHLGTLSPTAWPEARARREAAAVALLAVPIYALNGAGAYALAELADVASPSLVQMVAASLLGAIGAVVFVLVVAYYGTVVAVRFRSDPDTYGVPIVTSSVDFVGAVALILAIVALGLS